MSVGRDQRPRSSPADPSDRRRRSRSKLSRAHTFVVGAILGTFVFAPLGSIVLSALFDADAEDVTEVVSVDEPDEVPETAADALAERAAEEPLGDEPEVTAAVEAPETEPAEPVSQNVVESGQIRPNEFVAEVLKKAGASAVEQDRLVRALKGIYDFRNAQPGHAYQLEITPEGEVVRFTYSVGPAEVYEVERKDDELVGKKVDVELEREVTLVEGTIAVSLWEAFLEAGESPNLAMSLAEVFQYDVDFLHETRKGDTFRFFVEKFSADGEVVNYGRIYAAEYVGETTGRKALYWWDGKESKGYYDEKGQAAQRAFLRSPLKYSRISSPFGYRKHPILKRRHFHGGVDYAAPTGTPVQSVADGTVTWAAAKGPAGNMVRIRHVSGYESYYLHLSKILVKVGQRVSQSTVVGKVGSTGRSTGPHLDFRLKRNGKYLDPRKQVAPRSKGVARKEKKAYLQSIKSWQAKLKAKPVKVAGNPG